MRGAHKRPVTGPRAPQGGIVRCWSRVRPRDGLAGHRFPALVIEITVDPVKALAAALGLSAAAVGRTWSVVRDDREARSPAMRGQEPRLFVRV